MIICLIEFGVRPGMEAKNIATVQELLKEVVKIDGFISKETFDSRNEPGKLLTISYWRDEEALRNWMRNAEHRAGIKLGKSEIYSHYAIRIAEVQRENIWRAPS
jgi:heme-degrading monooxygenase HmoA